MYETTGDREVVQVTVAGILRQAQDGRDCGEQSEPIGL
jgi:hypothetical protein